MRKTRRLAAVLLLVLGAAGFTAACSSGSKSSAPKSAPKKDSGAGARVLECVVVERGQGAPSRTSSYSSGETYYLVFETKEGEATARYQYEVTRQQWFRYPEGSRVRVTLNNNILQNIQPSTEK